MRDRSKKIRTCIAPKLAIKKKPEIDRILEEAEAHMPKKGTLPRNFGKVDEGKVFSGKALESNPHRVEMAKSSGYISSCNKEALISSLWEAYTANLESLKALLGEDTRIKIAKDRVESVIEDWRLENAVD